RLVRLGRAAVAREAAARNAEDVLVAGVLRLAVADAAIARRVARHRLQLADVAVRLAALRVAADADRITAGLVADDRLARTTGQTARAAAVLVLQADVADDVASARGLADQHRRRTVRRAVAAAARAATGGQTGVVQLEAAVRDHAATENPVDLTAVRRAAGRIRVADSELLVHLLVADASAAVAAARADVAGLTAERARRADAAFAELRAAVAVLRAAVAERLAVV